MNDTDLLSTSEYPNDMEYKPTKPVAQSSRLQIYSILFGAAIAIGLFIDYPYLPVGIIISVRGIDIFIFRLIHGWHWRLADKYLIISGAYIAWAGYQESMTDFMGNRSYLDEFLLMVFLATLGFIYPLLTSLELFLLKLRCRKKEAVVADVLDSFLLDLPGAASAGRKYCPVFRVTNDGQDEYICDEWFTNTVYSTGEIALIRVSPFRKTEIYESERVKQYLKEKWRFWLIYESVIFFIMLMINNV